MYQPLVSIVTVVYNGRGHIEECINSVISQDYNNIEYIIIDGGSTDGTQEIIEKYQSNVAFFISEKDAGIYNAMNKGWKRATGEIIAILNSDDYYYPDTISQVVQQFKTSDTDVVYGNMVKTREIEGKNYYREERPDFSVMEKTMPIFHPSTFVKRRVYEELGGYNEEYRLSSDYDFVYRIYKKGFKFEYLAKPLSVFRLGGASYSGCTSYLEGVKILESHRSPYIQNMKRLVWKCRIKNMLRKVGFPILAILGLWSWYQKRIASKWKGTSSIVPPIETKETKVTG